jgi:hypothetical protein
MSFPRKNALSMWKLFKQFVTHSEKPLKRLAGHRARLHRAEAPVLMRMDAADFVLNHALKPACLGAIFFMTYTALPLLAADTNITIIDPYKLNANTLKLLEQAKKKQTAEAKDWKVFHDFQFADHYTDSGITFEHHVVDDAAKNWKPAHYDHGSAVAVADVDGDGLLDIYFVNQLGGNQLWRNLGHGKFENITASAGVGLESRICVGASFADIDNDGLPDLFVTTVKMGNVLFKNLGGGKFKDISKESGVDYVGHSSGATFFDFNNDGLLDLFVANVGVYTTNAKGHGGFYLAYKDAFTGHLLPERSEQSILYLNLGGGKFKDVSKEMHLQHYGWSGDASICDLNQDGYPDLYVLSMQGDDRYYENQGGKSFVEKTQAYFPKTPWGALGINFFDFNNDGRMDLFCNGQAFGHDGCPDQGRQSQREPVLRKKEKRRMVLGGMDGCLLAGCFEQYFGNAFYLNKGNGAYEEVRTKSARRTYWPWGVSVADLNADGYQDVFVTAGMGWLSGTASIRFC